MPPHFLGGMKLDANMYGYFLREFSEILRDFPDSPFLFVALLMTAVDLKGFYFENYQAEGDGPESLHAFLKGCLLPARAQTSAVFLTMQRENTKSDFLPRLWR